ncbi:MAG TPA: hypothetical protein VGS11_03500 [Candidatus Bathyarchaeia archaeon]|nr:hypothetical protein [Candidatus Bathyarchaeia archaeon]
MPDSSEPDRKKRFWEVDASTYVTSGRFGRRDRVFELVRAVGKYVLWGLILTYPFTLPLIGILFGGIAFWGAFGGSLLAIGILLWRFGLSGNFEERNISLTKSIVGLSGGFLCTLGFLLGLVFFNGWVFPIAFGLLGLVFCIALRRERL